MEVKLTMQEVNIIYEALTLVVEEKERLQLVPKTVAKYKYLKEKFEEFKS